MAWMWNFHYTFETCERSFISACWNCMTVSLMLDDKLWMNDSYSVKLRNGDLDINLDKDKLLGDVLLE